MNDPNYYTDRGTGAGFSIEWQHEVSMSRRAIDEQSGSDSSGRDHLHRDLLGLALVVYGTASKKH